jgi:hypothetical protein
VAFARGVSDGLDYAIKFFAVQHSFQVERALYNSEALGPLLPKVHAVYDASEVPEVLHDKRGRPLLSCIVMERGESLNEWSRRAKPDMFQSVAVRALSLLCTSKYTFCVVYFIVSNVPICDPNIEVDEVD